jgi:hypothetical protein
MPDSSALSPSTACIPHVLVHRGNPALGDVRSPSQACRQGPRAHHRLLTARTLPIPYRQNEGGHFARTGLRVGALEAGERPGPSSLVAHREVVETVALARGVNRGRRMQRMDGNLWEAEQAVETKGGGDRGARRRVLEEAWFETGCSHVIDALLLLHGVNRQTVAQSRCIHVIGRLLQSI